MAIPFICMFHLKLPRKRAAHKRMGKHAHRGAQQRTWQDICSEYGKKAELSPAGGTGRGHYAFLEYCPHRRNKRGDYYIIRIVFLIKRAAQKTGEHIAHCAQPNHGRIQYVRNKAHYQPEQRALLHA